VLRKVLYSNTPTLQHSEAEGVEQQLRPGVSNSEGEPGGKRCEKKVESGI
jgi:hypothetical protein